MKIKLFLTCCAFLLTLQIFAQSPRKLLLETFTDVNQTPSTQLNYFDSLTTANAADVCVLRYSSSAGTDPFYIAAPSDNSARILYYGNSNSNDCVSDGDYQNSTTLGNLTQASINAGLAVSSPATITVSHQVNLSTNTLTVNGVVHFTGNLSMDDYVLMIAVAERSVDYNGNMHYNILRKFLPDAAGSFYNAAYAPGDSIVFTQTWVGMNNVANLNEMQVIVFFQNANTKDLIQAEISAPYQVVGVQSLQEEPVIELYPNPAGDNFQLKMPDSGNAASYCLINALGVVVKPAQVVNQEITTVNTTDLSAGLYFVQISVQGKTYTKKLIKN